MTIIARTDFTRFDGDHDAGLEHPHDWARDRGTGRRHGPLVANASAVPTPSSALHDDALYAPF